MTDVSWRQGPPRRARTTAELKELQAAIFDEQQMEESARSFQPRASDVIISPFAKCGTTMLQQLFHCLRTGGDLNFDEISRVVPWIEMAAACGIDLDTEQKASPRGFKSHLPFDRIPKGGKYIVAIRDPKDTLVSLYRFLEGWRFEPGDISFEDFAEARLSSPHGFEYWHHLTSWWEQRDNPSVLLLSFAQLLRQPDIAIQQIANFCGIPLNDKLLRLTREHSSFAFMSAHKDQFDESIVRKLSEIRGHLPAGSETSKVRSGSAGAYKAELPAKTGAELDEIWRRDITTRFGFESFEEFDTALRGLSLGRAS